MSLLLRQIFPGTQQPSPLPHSSSLSAVGSSPQRLCVSGSAAARKDDQEDVTAESRASGAENPNKKKSVIMRCEFSVSKIRFSFFYFRHSASDFLTLRIYAVKSPNGSGVGGGGGGRGGDFLPYSTAILETTIRILTTEKNSFFVMVCLR